MNQSFLIKMFRYGLSSGAALAIDVGLMSVLIEFFSIPYLYAAAAGFSAGCILNYFISKYFVFENRSTNSDSVTASLFVLVGIGGLLLNHLILYVGVDIISAHYLIAKIVSAGTVFWFNFLIRGFFVFKDPDLCKIKQKT